MYLENLDALVRVLVQTIDRQLSKNRAYESV